MDAGMKKRIAALLCACMLCGMICPGMAEGWDDGGWDAGGWDDGGGDLGTDSGSSGGGTPSGLQKKGRTIRLPSRRMNSVGIVPMPVDEAGMDPAAADNLVAAADADSAEPVIEDSMAQELLSVLGDEGNSGSVEYAAYLSLATKLGLGDTVEEILVSLQSIVNR